MFKILWVILVIAGSGGALAQAPIPLQPRDIFALNAASDPRISPDGEMVAYVRRSNEIANDQTQASLWLMSSDGSGLRQIGNRGAERNSPRWSPDGQALAYLQAGADYAAIRVYSRRNGRDIEVARVRGGAAGLAWSPDGTRLAWAGFVAQPGMIAADLPARTADMQWAAGASVEDRLIYRFDGIGDLPHGRQQLFVVNAAGGDPVQLTSDLQGAGGDLAWSAAGDAILFSADRREGGEALAPDTEIFRLALADSSLSALTSREGPDLAPRPSPDGGLLAYLGYDDHRMGYDNVRLYIANADGSAPRVLSQALDRSLANPQWSGDGRSLYVQYEDEGTMVIARIDLDGQLARSSPASGPIPSAGPIWAVNSPSRMMAGSRPRSARRSGPPSSPLPRPGKTGAC